MNPHASLSRRCALQQRLLAALLVLDLGVVAVSLAALTTALLVVHLLRAVTHCVCFAGARRRNGNVCFMYAVFYLVYVVSLAVFFLSLSSKYDTHSLMALIFSSLTMWCGLPFILFAAWSALQVATFVVALHISVLVKCSTAEADTSNLLLPLDSPVQLIPHPLYPQDFYEHHVAVVPSAGEFLTTLSPL
eukprot:TRINITY_DN6137_c0_g1_i1.p2 TRINITY_DN6137_c0_g1~~TRINITY_DN6137_c0_g1_i1.p2  ORF type:complete len:190 (+),score=63.25 TRINITY_DN6137_c0_g1_i1:151-720(+)